MLALWSCFLCAWLVQGDGGYTSRSIDVDAIFVINLVTRHDRRRHIENELSRLGILELATFIPAVTKNEAAASSFEAMPPEMWVDKGNPFRFYSRPILAGEVACTLSHLKVWNIIKDKGLSRAIILEDDVELANHLPAVLTRILQQLPQDWDLFYLYHRSLGEATDELKQALNFSVEAGDELVQSSSAEQPSLIVRNTFSYKTSAYMIHHKSAHKLISCINKKNMIPADELLAASYWPHFRQVVRESLGECTAYIANATIVTQLLSSLTLF
jgi:GR25 family glycosyltransferase involved in LPS biosynthesis